VPTKRRRGRQEVAGGLDPRRRGPLARRGPVQGRPDRLLLPVTGSIILLTIWAGGAHASGSEWVQALGALVAGIVLVGLVAPRIALARVRLTVEATPADAVSGEPFEIVVTSSAHCRCVALRPEGPAVFLRAGRPTRVQLVPDHRGRLSAVVLGVSTAAPIGILWWTGRSRVDLPRVVTVAPRRGAPSRRALAGGAEGEQEGRRVLADQGELHSIREYRVGDSPRQVHWRSTAHAGSLMVRESERREDRAVRLVAELSPDVELAEVEASEIMGTITSLLERRRRVVLETTEDGQPVVATIATERDAGRQLARAGQNPWHDLGPPSAGPAPQRGRSSGWEGA
jgi:uncharacterized protein (DUF58 family)